MSLLAAKDDRLSGLVGADIPSSSIPGVRYVLRKVLGEGAMAVAFLAERRGPEGAGLAVLKLMRPSVAENSSGAALAAHKEATALLHLGSAGVPTPYVVRLVDLGNVPVVSAGVSARTLTIPWIAMEYVEGGPDGTTLMERVRNSVRATSSAFHPRRASSALECLAQGLSAVHRAGIVHRDIKPANVLCSGVATDEIYKIADFGIARAEGVVATFGPAIVGSLGYAPPEQLEMRTREIGPWSDVFALAGVVYFLLTGERYFPPESLGETVRRIRGNQRRKLRDAAGLHPEIREREYDCAVIDAVLADATAPKISDRIQSVALMAEPILRAVFPREAREPHQIESLEEIDTESIIDTEVDRDATTVIRPWSWTVRQIPGSQTSIRNVAWDGDGRCLAATAEGLRFWDGAQWHAVGVDGFSSPGGVRFVVRLPPSSWLIGGDDATLVTLSHEGNRHVLRGPDPGTTFEQAHGEFGDLAVLVGDKGSGSPSLYPVVGRYWLKPFPLTDVAVVNSIVRHSRDTWLVAGRLNGGRGFVALFAPTRWELTPILGCTASSYFQCAANMTIGQGIVVGSDGQFTLLSGASVMHETIPESSDLTAAAVDARGRLWVGGVGELWAREPGPAGAWLRVWSELGWTAPLKSLFVMNERVLALTSDGGIIEGRVTLT